MTGIRIKFLFDEEIQTPPKEKRRQSRLRCHEAVTRRARVANGTMNTLATKSGLFMITSYLDNEQNFYFSLDYRMSQAKNPVVWEFYSKIPSSRTLRVLNFAPVPTLDCKHWFLSKREEEVVKTWQYGV